MQIPIAFDIKEGGTTEFFRALFVKKGFNLAGKSVKIDVEHIIRTVDRTVAGNFYLMSNNVTPPSAGIFSPLYYGDLIVKTFVQTFTSGSFDKEVDIVEINSLGAAYFQQEKRANGLVAAELGLPSDAAFQVVKSNDIIFADVVQILAGAAPVGTLRSELVFTGYKISLI